MSSSGERGLGRSRLPLKKKCPYRGNLNKTLEQLNQARAHLQVALEERQLILERENVLCDIISTQACVMEQLQKHWSWLYGMLPEELQAGAEPSSAPAFAQQQNTPQLHQNQYRQHTCVRLVEAATPQLLQQVLAMTTQDWVRLCRCHFRELAVLLELVNRPPQVYREDPAAFEAAAAVAASLAAKTDAAAAGQSAPNKTAAAAAAAAAARAAKAAAKDKQLQQMSISEPGLQVPGLSSASSAAREESCATEAAAAAARSSEDDFSLPWELDPMRLLFEALCRQGVKFQAALLHNSMPLFEAGSMNLETLRHELPSPQFWRRAVDRLHLSPSQVVHFKVALQEYRRLTRAATAAGLDLVQHIKEFSLSDVAARYARAGEQPAAAAAEQPSMPAAAAGCSGAAASATASDAAAAAMLDVDANGYSSGITGSDNTTSGPSSTGSGTSVGGSSGRQQVLSAAGVGQHEHAAAAGNQQPNGDCSLQQLDGKLQRHYHSFFINMYLVNTFCINVLTPYQHAVMWCASYPYCPVLGAMAEALEAVPPSDPLPLPAHVAARITSNIEQHTACRSAVIAQQRKDLCWWEA